MTKTTKEKEEHRHRAMLIANQMGEEYRDWFGWPEHLSFGRLVAIGEYISELCEIEPHDDWLDDAKAAFEKWKTVHHITTTTPRSNQA